MQPSDLIKLPDDEERLKEHYTRLKAEGKLATVRKQTPEEQELMARIKKLNRQ